MDCTECGRTNRPGAKFCAGCATPIVAPCSSCGHPLAPDSRFCDQCGTSTDAIDTPAATADTTSDAKGRPADDAVRKTVTTLFCDLVGSTALEERVDAESSRDVLGRYHSMVESVIVAGGGTVAKFIGDGVMAVFGIPEVAVDDADRAVTAGLELQRRFLALRTHITGRFDIDVGLRVGVNTGEVVIADADADLVGDSLNVAARLEAACTPGEVLVGEDTWRLTRATVEYEPFGVLELKGKEEAVATYRAVDLLAEADDSATPFVGRDEELDRLRAVFDEAATSDSVRLATVIGAPGVGKTRLSRELERALDDEAAVVELRCERAGGTTFAPIADLLRSVAALDDGLSNEETVERLTALVGELDDAERVASLLISFVRATQTRSTEELFFAVRRLVEALGRERPLTLVIDDIQWAEPLFLDLLEHLTEWGQDSPVLILGLARPELREIRPSLTEVGRRVSESIALEGLDAAATAELAGLLVGGDALPRDLLARLPESTEGNPLFVRELMMMLVDDDVIIETERGWELAIDADAVEVPPTIQSLLSSRIERMPDDERRLVELAAVVGPEFPLGAVAAIGTAGDAATLTATLERLRRKELVEPTGTYWGDEPLFRFHHVLIRDAAYRRLLKGRRADLHLRVAEWIEGVGATDVGEQQVTVGYHLEQAHDYRTQLDVADGETVAIGRRAAEMLGAAAERALERDDVAAAGSLAVRAVARLDHEAEERNDLLMLGCEALFSLGDVGAAVPLLKELRGGSDDDVRLAAWVRAFDAQLVVLTDPERLEEAESESAAAATELAALDDHAGEANARLVRSGALARLGRIGECEAELDLALGAARTADDGRRVASVLGAAPVAALWGPSPVSRAGGRCLDVIRLLRITTGSPGVEATSTRCQAVLEALRGRFDTARTMLGEALATVEELGLRHGWLETQLYSGIVELLAGDPAAAEPFLRSAYGGLGRLGIGADAGQAAAHLSRALLLQGRLDEADELAADSEALAGQNPQTAIAAKTARAEILAARGDVSEALRLAEEAVAHAEGTDIVIDHANANVALARVRAAAGDAEGAGAARRAAESLFAAKGASVDLGDLEVLEPTVPAPIESTSEVVRVGEESGMRDADEPWNRADEIALRADRAERPTEDLLREVFAVDIEFDNSRRSLYSTHLTGIDAWIEFLDRIRADAVGSPADTVEEIERLAARGDHLVLWLRRRRSSSDPQGALRTRIELIRTDHRDRIDRFIHFDESDLADALGELDRLYLADVDDLATRFLVQRYAESYGALSGGDVDGVLASMDEAYVHHDHRALGWGVLDREDMTSRFASLAGIDGEARSYVARYRGHAGQVDWTEAHIRVVGTDGSTQVDRQHLVNAFDRESGMNVRTDRYDDDQLDEARATFEATAHTAARSGSPWNAAVQIAGHAYRWAARGDSTRFATMLSDDLIVEAGGTPLVADVTALHDPATARTIGFGSQHRRVLAVRGERLVLAELRDDSTDQPCHRVVVEEIDDDCRLARITHFAPTALADAALRMELRWLELEGAAHADVVRAIAALAHARATGDSERVRAGLADDCRFADHRFPGLPGHDMSWLFDMIDSERANESWVTGVPARMLAINAHGWLSWLQPWRNPESGPLEHEGLPILSLGTVANGRVSALEFFPDEQLDAALTRFEELTGEGEIVDVPSNADGAAQSRQAEPVDEEAHKTGDPESLNGADAAMRRAFRAGADRDLDRFTALCAPDVVRHNRRRLHGTTQHGVAEIMDGLGAFEAGNVVLDIDTVAVRGDRLAVHHVEQRSGDDLDGAALHFLHVARSNEAGVIDLAIVLDPDDLDTAMVELGRLWEEGGEVDRAFDFAALTWSQWQDDVNWAWQNELDWTRALAHWDERVELIDHREIGWPVVDYEGVKDRLESFRRIATSGTTTIPWLHAADGLLGLAVMQTDIVEPSGAEHVDRNLFLVRLSPDSGTGVATEQFAVDDLSAAMARFVELVHEQERDDRLWNIASVAANRAHTWSRRGHPIAGIVLADDIVIADEHGESLSTDQDLDEPGVARRLGLGVEHRRVLAVRGDRVALMELRDDDVDGERFHKVAVVEIDENCRVARVRLFDVESLEEASRHLGHRWLDVDRPSHPRGIELSLDFATADAAGDWSHLAEHCAFVDHRALGFGPGDKTWVTDVSGSRADVGGTRLNPRVLGWNDRGTYSSVETWARAENGELVQSATPAIAVRQVTDDKVTAIEIFGEDDLGAARARFEELTTADAPIIEHEPWNVADALARRALQAWARGEVDKVTDDFDPAIRMESRRFAGVSLTGTTGRDEVLGGLRDGPVFPEATALQLESIACRGDRLVLLHATYRQIGDLDGPSIEMLMLLRLTEEGLMDLSITWDTDHLDEAIAELDRLYLEQDPGPEMAAALCGWTEAYDALNSGPTSEFGDRIMLNFDPELQMVDHRGIGWPEQDFETFRERVESLRDLDGELTFVIARLDRVEGSLSLAEEVTTYRSPDGAVQTDRSLIVGEASADSGLMVRLDQFSVDDRARADDHFGSRALELARDDTLHNIATGFADRAHTWARAGVWERAASLFAQDIVVQEELGSTVVVGSGALADAESAAGVGWGSEHRQVLAVRGEQLALVAWTDADRQDEPFRRFALIESNRRAQFERITLYDWSFESLRDAADALDLRWAEIEELSDHELLQIEFISAFRHRDGDRMTAVMAEGFHIADHRSMGWGEFDREGWLALFENPEIVPMVPIVGRHLADNRDGFCVQLAQWHPDADDLVEALPGCWVARTRSGRLEHVEGINSPEAARTRLNELTDETDTIYFHEPWNDADRLTRRYVHAFDFDPEAWRGMLSPELVYRDMRSFVADEYHGPKEVEEAFPPGFVRQTGLETLATRGDDFVLFWSAIATRDDDQAFKLELVVLQRWADGRLALTELFEPDDLESAIDEFDRLYLESDPGPIQSHRVRALREAATAYMDGRVEDRAALLHDDFESVDHRQLGWPTLDRYTVGQRSQTIRDMGDATVYLARIHPTPGSSVLFQIGARVDMDDGPELRSGLGVQQITVTDPESGLQLLDEKFGIDEVHAARQRLDELEAEHSPPGRVENLASSLANRAHSLMNRGRWDLFASVLSDDVVVETAEGEVLASSRADLTDPVVARSVGFGVGERTVLSAPGEQLALMAWCDDDFDGESFRRFAVVELNRRAEIERITQFDWDITPLIAAADFLDERFLEIDQQSDVGLTGLRFARAFRHRDIDELARLMHDDFDSIDSRSLGFGEQDKEGWLTLFEPDLPSPMATIVGRFLDETTDGLAVRMSQWALVDGELTEALPGCFVAQMRDGRIVHTAGFDDAETALARLDELSAD